MAKILIVDDDVVFADMLVGRMVSLGYEARSAHNLADGVFLLKEYEFDVVLLDVQLPDGNGLEYIPTFLAAKSNPEVIIITGQGDPDGAEKAVVSGAWSYIEKPYAIRELGLQLKRAFQYRSEKRKVSKIPVSLKREDIIGNSQAISRCLDQVARAASSDVSVLLTGATGTGKELFARAIHENSGRQGENFVVVDCAALPDNLIESTLFGHIKGAFTSAESSNEGLVKHADGGTLFLDEVGELPLSIQKNFLRLLQEREYRPVGSVKQLQSDFRVVAATNRDLQKCVEDGIFRADLLYRLQAFTLELPTLKERLEDIRELVLHFANRLCRRYDLENKGVTADFIEPLMAYDWPGNVRELYQVMEQVFSDPHLGPTCFGVHLPDKFRVHLARNGVGSKAREVNPGGKDLLPSWSVYKSQCELDYMLKLRDVSKGNISEASRISKISRTRLYQLIEKNEIDFS